MDPLGYATTSWLDSIANKWLCIRGGFDNNYCASYLNGIRCDNPVATNREKWKITKVSDDTILLQTARNKLYCDNQRLRIKCQNRHPQDWSAFKVQYQGENRFVMRGLGDWNYCIDEGGNVKCDADESEFNGQGWEVFTVDSCGVYEGPAAVMPEEYFWAVLPSPLHSNPTWTPAANSGASPIIEDTSNPVTPKQCRECLPKQVNRGNTSNNYGAAIAVGCCDLDGGSATRVVEGKDQCRHSVDWTTATLLCKSRGKRLCTDDEIEDGMLAYKGCDLDGLLHWTNTPCFALTPATGDKKDSGNFCPQDPYMWTVIGNPQTGMYPTGGCPTGTYSGVCPKQPLECRPKSEITSVTANSFGNALGVVCCEHGGGKATRLVGPNNKCISAVNWFEAFQACSQRSLRLCTLEEIEHGAGRGPDCNFDNYLQWSMTPCEPATPCCGDPPGRYPLYDQFKALAHSSENVSNSALFGYAATQPKVGPCVSQKLVASDWSSSSSEDDAEKPCVPGDSFMASNQ